MMAKFALCINTQDAPVAVQVAAGLSMVPIEQLFFTTPTRLIDRAFCETDRSTLQLLPYIVLKSEDQKIFCYHRGDAGAEDRLHGKLSIGLGGHVDISPEGDSSLYEVLIDETEREFAEETGILANPILGGHSVFKFTDFLVDFNDDVGSVHLGLLTSYWASDSEIAIMREEKGIVEKGSFMTLAELRAPEVHARLENWSRVIVDNM